MMQERRASPWILPLILIAGAAARLIAFADYSFSNDELSALLRLDYDSLEALLNEGVRPDGHPAFTHTLLWTIKQWFGDSEFALRLPGVLAGIASIWLIFSVGKQWFSRATGLWSAAAMAFLCAPILYSQVARPYTFGIFFVLLTAHLWSRFLITEKPQKWWHALILGAVAALGLTTHYFAALVIVLIGLSGFLMIRKDRLLLYVVALVTTALLFLPHLGITMDQLAVGGVGGPEGWLQAPGADFVTEHISFLFNDSWGLFFVLLAFAIVMAARHRKNQEQKRLVWLALLWWLLPLAIGFVYSHLRNPVLQDSVLLFSFPFLLILLFSSFGSETKSKYERGALLLLLVGMLHTFAINRYHPQQHFGNFKGVMACFADWQKEHQTEGISFAANVNHPFYLNHYAPDTNAPRIEPNRFDSENLGRLVDAVREAEGEYFAYGWSTTADPEETESIIRSKFPEVVKDTIWFNSRATIFRSTDQVEVNRQYLKEAAPGYQAEFELVVDQEFGINITLSEELMALAGKKIILSALIKSDQAPTQARLVAHYTRNDEEVIYKAPAAATYQQYAKQAETCFVAVRIPEEVSEHDVLKFYLWNQGRENITVDWVEVYVDDLSGEPSRDRSFSP